MKVGAAVSIGVLSLGSLCSFAAGAQQVELAQSEALQCLTPDRPERFDVEYPFVALKDGLPGRVKVALDFTAFNRGPLIRVVESEGGREFVEAVERAVKRWRVPCLPAEHTTTLLQEFVFKPDDRRVYWGDTADAGDGARRGLARCLTHVSGERMPEYPASVRRAQIQGRVYAEMTFRAADQPPEAAVFARAYAEPLRAIVVRWVDGYRLPCLPAGETVRFSVVMVYRFEGEAYGFKPLTLRQVVASAKGVRQQGLTLDTTAMSCPFDVRFTYYAPVRRNRVGMIGSDDPARRPLLEWLAGVELDLPQRTLDAVFADTTIISIPCLKIDLTPKEPT